jgi:hypothetical protein
VHLALPDAEIRDHGYCYYAEDDPLVAARIITIEIFLKKIQ